MLFYSPDHDVALTDALHSLRKALLVSDSEMGIMKEKEEEEAGWWNRPPTSCILEM